MFGRLQLISASSWAMTRPGWLAPIWASSDQFYLVSQECLLEPQPVRKLSSPLDAFVLPTETKVSSLSQLDDGATRNFCDICTLGGSTGCSHSSNFIIMDMGKALSTNES